MPLLHPLLPLLSALWLTPPAAAHEGHDHGPAPPPPVSAPLAPRVATESADFELVAVLSADGELTLWLDDFATNAPVPDAVLDIERGAWRVRASHAGDGVYQAPAGPLAEPGEHDLLFVIEAGARADLLLGRLSVPAAPVAVAPATAAAWYRSVPLLQGLVMLLALGLVAALWRWDRRREATSVWLLALLLVAPAPLPAHEGHDHGPPPVPTVAPTADSGATRLPDGTLFVPKPMQRLLGLRTAQAEAGEWPDTFTLTGHVIPDPNASALVQAPLPGRIELPADGLPQLGARVSAGQVLAWLVPILEAVDRTAQQAELAELAGRIENLARNLERLQALGSNAPRQELEQTATEHGSLVARRAAIAASFVDRVPLAAPVTGVLALRNASPGQIVAGGETLFTLVDPERLLVEALLYDTDHATHFTAASATTAEGRVLRLTPLGSGYELRGHALPIQFRIEAGGRAGGGRAGPAPPGPAPPGQEPLVVRQPLTVVARMHHGSAGLRIPSAAVQRDPDGAALVWLHVRPEHFRAQPVQVRPLGDGDSVVSEGLNPGDRVVTDGAALLGQVR